MSWFFTCLRKYADFSGRARRREYGWFNLVFGIVVLIFYILVFFALPPVSSTGSSQNALALIIFIVFGLFFLAMIIPSWSVTVRRLHDIGLSGWWFLVGLVPLIGSFWFLVLMFTDSRPGDNQYGPNPKVATTIQGMSGK